MPRNTPSSDNGFTSDQMDHILSILRVLQSGPLTYIRELKLKAISAQDYSKAASLRAIELELLKEE